MIIERDFKVMGEKTRQLNLQSIINLAMRKNQLNIEILWREPREININGIFQIIFTCSLRISRFEEIEKMISQF